MFRISTFIRYWNFEQTQRELLIILVSVTLNLLNLYSKVIKIIFIIQTDSFYMIYLAILKILFLLVCKTISFCRSYPEMDISMQSKTRNISTGKTTIKLSSLYQGQFKGFSRSYFYCSKNAWSLLCHKYDGNCVLNLLKIRINVSGFD